MSAYEHLLSPGRIGPLELRNRMVMTAMGEDLGDPDGMLSDTQIAYLEARARGGLALVQIGSVAVAYPRGCANKYQTALSDDRHVEPWSRAASRIHEAGALLGMQLSHMGKNSVHDIRDGEPMWVPSAPRRSAVDPLYTMVTPDEGALMQEPHRAPTAGVSYRVMDHDDIATVIDQFATAAERAVAAGVDAVELHAGHGYLLDAFLSPSVNRRDDDYGGSVENRARLLVETLREIRRRVDHHMAVWVRLNAFETDIDGIELADAVVTARLAQAAGADLVNVSAYHDPGVAVGPTDSYCAHQPELLVDAARTVRSSVDVPVMTVGRISPERADVLIAEGAFDFLGLGRPILADPELAAKLARGTPDDVRPCVYHYRCIGQIFIRQRTRCVANGFLGRDDEVGLTATAAPRRVAVVGGGPGGMEAARVAALAGHDVTLYEAGPELGGRWIESALTAGPNDELLDWMRRQVERLDIDVRLGALVSADELGTAGLDAVIVATGGRWNRPAVEGADLVHVVDAANLGPFLTGAHDVAGLNVVVLGGDIPGLGAAGTLSEAGARVTILEPTSVFGSALGLPGRWRLVHDLGAAGLSLEAGAEVAAIADNGVIWRRAGETVTTPADLVIALGDVVPDPTFAASLAGLGIPVTSIGDCRNVGYLEGAMAGAVEAAVAL